MFRTPVSQPVRQQIGTVVGVPAPIGGWNARDSIANMPPGDAVILENWFPTTSDVQFRKGYTNKATGLTGQVESLMVYNPASGAQKLFAAAGANVYNVTTTGPVGAPDLTGFTSARWEHTNFATSAGPFLLMVNGVNGYYIYNGTTWQSVTSVSVPISITGVNPANLIHVQVFASRVWFIERDTLKAWYLPVGQVGGAATAFDFSAIFPRGGRLVSMGVWTVDGGVGMQDYAVWVTSEGEIAVYQGTDPSQASTFQKVGVYFVGAPMGVRCFSKFGGDLLYIGLDGVAPMSKLLASSRVNTQVQITNKIQYAISQATAQYQFNFGWQLQLFPKENMLILNVPVALGQQEQFVMNTITGAWCNFKAWNANCWTLFQDHVYFGGNTIVAKAWDSTADNGISIVGEALPAFMKFGSDQLKQFLMVRPIFTTNGTPSILLVLDVDYEVTGPTGTPSFSPTSVGIWDLSLWDVGIWGQDAQILKNWEYAAGIGISGAMHMKLSSSTLDIRWVSVDYLVKGGGVL